MRYLVNRFRMIIFSLSCIIFLALLFVSIDGKCVKISTKQNGNWTSSSTWDLGRLPQDGDTIFVVHATEIPNRGSVSLNGVAVIISVSLDLVNQAEIALDAASTITLLPNVTISRSTGNGVMTINGTDLTSNGNGVMKTGAAFADKNGWGGQGQLCQLL